MRSWIRSAAALLVMSGCVHADVVYDNGTYFEGSSVWIQSDPTGSPPAFVADSFTLAQAGPVTGVVFWGGYNNGDDFVAVDSFSIVFYGDSGGLPDPDNVIASYSLGDLGKTDTGDTISGYRVYQYSADFSAASFGTSAYWISIVNDTTGDTSEWTWWTTEAAGPGAVSYDSGASWGSLSYGNMSFELNAVPEPGTLILWGVGLAGAAGATRRRRKSLNKR